MQGLGLSMQLTASNCLMGPPCHQALLGGNNTSVQEAHLVGPKGACQGWLQRYMPFAALSGFPFWHHPLPLLSPACQCQPHSLIPQQGLKVADSSTATRWPQTTRKWPRGGWTQSITVPLGRCPSFLPSAFASVLCVVFLITLLGGQVIGEVDRAVIIFALQKLSHR